MKAWSVVAHGARQELRHRSGKAYARSVGVMAHGSKVRALAGVLMLIKHNVRVGHLKLPPHVQAALDKVLS